MFNGIFLMLAKIKNERIFAIGKVKVINFFLNKVFYKNINVRKKHDDKINV